LIMMTGDTVVLSQITQTEGTPNILNH